MQLLALQAWHDNSKEGLLVIDASGNIELLNRRLKELLSLNQPFGTIDDLIAHTRDAAPELGAILSLHSSSSRAQWGSLRVQQYPPRRLSWEQYPLIANDKTVGSLTIFRDAIAQGQLEFAKQSFLSMISHDLRTPLSTILGFAELMYNNRDNLSPEEIKEFLEHIIQNANELTLYTQIAMDIMFLEANLQTFKLEPVELDKFIKQWLSDAVHRFPAERLIYHSGTQGPPASVAPAALHKILYILTEFALKESPPEAPVEIELNYERSQAHIIIEHQAPRLQVADAAVLFRLMHPRDLSELGRPDLHRMQLYVAILLAEQQQGYLTLKSSNTRAYKLDLVLPLALPPHQRSADSQAAPK